MKSAVVNGSYDRPELIKSAVGGKHSWLCTLISTDLDSEFLHEESSDLKSQAFNGGTEFCRSNVQIEVLLGSILTKWIHCGKR